MEPAFSNSVKWCLKSPQNARILSSRLISQSSSISLNILHCFHLCGSIHLLDVVDNLFRLTEWPYCISQLCSRGSSEALETLLSLCISSSSDGAQNVLGLIIEDISSLSPCSEELLRSLLRHIDFENFPSPTFQKLFEHLFGSALRTNEELITIWQGLDSDSSSTSQNMANIFLEATPPSILISSILSLVSSTTLSIDLARSLQLVRSLPVDDIYASIFEITRSSLSLHSLSTSTALILLAHLINTDQYYHMLVSLVRDHGLAESLFEVLLPILSRASDDTSYKHVDRLKAASKSHPTIYSSFKSQLASIRDTSAASTSGPLAAPVVLATNSSSTNCDSVIDRWVSAFQSTSKLPMKELGALKIFSPAVLTSSLESLLIKSQSLPDSSPYVHFVLQMAKAKQFTGKKYEQWLEFRMAEQRRLMCSRSSPALKLSAAKTYTLKDLQLALGTWSKNISSGGTASIGSIVSALVEQSASINPSSIFVEIWQKFSDAANSDWKSKNVELDKLFSCTIVAHHTTFYPHLEATILREFNEVSPNWSSLALSITVISSHDRLPDREILQRLWTSEALLRIQTKNCLSCTLHLLKTLLQITTARFKSLTIRSGSSHLSAVNSDKERSSSRSGVLDVSVVQFITWVSSKLSSCLTDLRFIAVEISEILRLPSLAHLLSSVPSIEFEVLIEMEMQAEGIGLCDFGRLKSSCDSLLEVCNTVLLRDQLIYRLYKAFSRVNSSSHPLLSRILRGALFEAANGIFDLKIDAIAKKSNSYIPQATHTKGNSFSAHNSASTLTSQNHLSRAASAPITALTASTMTGSLEHLASIDSESKTSANSSGTNWLLNYLFSTLESEKIRSSHQSSKSSLETWIQLIREVDGRWWTISSAKPQKSSFRVFSTFLRLFDQLCKFSSSKAAFLLLSDCLNGISMSVKTRFITEILTSSASSISVLSIHLAEARSILRNNEDFLVLTPVLEHLDSLGRSITIRNATSASKCISLLEASELPIYATFITMAIRNGNFFCSELFESLRLCPGSNGNIIASQILLSSFRESLDLIELVRGVAMLPRVLTVLNSLESSPSILARLLPIIDGLLDPGQLQFISEQYSSWKEILRSEWIRCLTEITGKIVKDWWLIDSPFTTQYTPAHIQERSKYLLMRLQPNHRLHGLFK